MTLEYDMKLSTWLEHIPKLRVQLRYVLAEGKDIHQSAE